MGITDSNSSFCCFSNFVTITIIRVSVGDVSGSTTWPLKKKREVSSLFSRMIGHSIVYLL